MGKTSAFQKPVPTDPFFYGFRHVEVTLPNGETDLETVPLTEEDVLHPQLGDHITNGTLHDELGIYLKNVLQERLRNDPSALVLHDCGVYWDVKALRHHSPDIAVIFGAGEQPIEQTGFMVAQEGVRPSLIIEIVSASTRSSDFGKKIKHYHVAKVPQYVIVDRDEEGMPSRLLSHRDTPKGYRLEPTDDHGRVLLECVNLWLEIRGPDLVLIDAETGEEFKSYIEVTEAMCAAEARADEEAKRAEKADRLAKKEARRAEMEARRAETEARRADEAEKKLQAMEEELRRLRDKG